MAIIHRDNLWVRLAGIEPGSLRNVLGVMPLYHHPICSLIATLCVATALL